jgi:hypothetical protein
MNEGEIITLFCVSFACMLGVVFVFFCFGKDGASEKAKIIREALRRKRKQRGKK